MKPKCFFFSYVALYWPYGTKKFGGCSAGWILHVVFMHPSCYL
ncbi:unnamed protein product [Prunus brigantina]